MASLDLNIKRCAWVSDEPIYLSYHDDEWGVPVYDDEKLFEFLLLEGAQAGLNWITILKKRDSYRLAFDQFNPFKMAHYTQSKIEHLLNNRDIVRNRAKINAFITNAQAYLAIKEQVSFADYIWQFVEGSPMQNHWPSLKNVPVRTLVAEKMAQDLKQRGFKFIGSTICYAFMQAVGMVNDHTVNCFRHRQLFARINPL